MQFLAIYSALQSNRLRVTCHSNRERLADRDRGRRSQRQLARHLQWPKAVPSRRLSSTLTRCLQSSLARIS